MPDMPHAAPLLYQMPLRAACCTLHDSTMGAQVPQPKMHYCMDAPPASGLSIFVCLGYGDAQAHRDAQAQRAHQSGLWAGSGDPGCCHDHSLRAAKLCLKFQGMGGYWRQAAGERLHCSVLTVADKCVIVVCLLTLHSLLLNILRRHLA
jgi:hypothetical protein